MESTTIPFPQSSTSSQRDSQSKAQPRPPCEGTELDDFDIAVSTLLPGSSVASQDATTRQSSETGRRTHSAGVSTSTDRLSNASETYMDRVQRLSSRLPHLRNVLLKSRRQGAVVECYDFHGGLAAPVRTFSEAPDGSGLFTERDESLCDVLGDRDVANFDMRLIVATDLSTTLIECLGSHLWMNPEFFEEHLLNSGWHNVDEDKESNVWITRDMVKDFTSVKWYRPVKENLDHAWEDEDQTTMLETGAMHWWQTVKETRPRLRVRHSISFVHNIVRGKWWLSWGNRGKEGVQMDSGWEERATVWYKRFNGSTIVVILLDPLVEVTERVSGSRKALLTGGYNVQGAEAGGPASTITDILLDQLKCVYRQFEQRRPLAAYDSLMSSPEKAFFPDTESTADSLRNWLLGTNPPAERSGEHLPYLLECLSLIIEKDTMDVLHIMDLTLTELTRDFADDAQLQRRLLHWRKSLMDLDRDLKMIEESLRKFAKFVQRLVCNEDFFLWQETSVSTKSDFHRCFDQISILRYRTNRSSKTLIANISILESKRGIAEAESVTKLTELAFFFIPLTFSASIFSMQVKELSSPHLSISAFFALAIIITAGSYALRLIIRSPIVVVRQQQIMRQIAQFAHLNAGSPVRTRDLFLWLWSTIKPASYLGLIWFVSAAVGIIVSAVLLGALWTRSLQQGIKIPITLCICVLFMSCIFFVIFPRAMTRRRRRSLDDDG